MDNILSFLFVIFNVSKKINIKTKYKCITFICFIIYLFFFLKSKILFEILSISNICVTQIYFGHGISFPK
jgi:hypothetical protein